VAEQEQDKSEDATPFKLDEAKKRGQVAKSLEVNSWFVISSFLTVLYIYGNNMILELAHVSRTTFSHAGQINYSPDELVLWFSDIFSMVVSIVTPLVTVLAVIAVLMNMFQTGPVFSFHPIKPDFNKLNPVTGLKRIFSMRTVYETIKSLLKLVLFGSVVYFFVMGIMPKLLNYMHVIPQSYPFAVLELVETLILQLAGVLLLFALFDLVYSRRDFSNKMKMSKREVKEETKRRDGDPQVKAKIKELQREAAKRAQSASRVPEADVLITNPTHKAIAIKYDRNEMSSPQVIAKGAGELALKMRKIARKNNVPIIENKPLARALFKKVALNSGVPSMFFSEVAKILVKVYSSREKRPVF
jgi:flagellar biosynthesis protein FlhB